MIPFSKYIFGIVVLWTLVFGLISEIRAEVLVKSGDKIAFLGDSITAFGGGPGGYCNLVIDGLKANGIDVQQINAGVSGNCSREMLARFEKDVIENKPDWMTLSCGVNDVWHGEGGVKLEDYKKNITKIVTKTQAAGIKVMILTATMIGEDPHNDNNKKLKAYNDFLKQLAKSKNCQLADLNADMQKKLAECKKNSPPSSSTPASEAAKNWITVDGVHMNPIGNRMMAQGILTAFGLDADQIKKAQETWNPTQTPAAP